MKLKIISKTNNPLLKRNEIAFIIDHSKTGGTPTRSEISKELANLLKVDLGLINIKEIRTKTGTMFAVGHANIYDSIKQAELVEPKHLITKNKITIKSEESKTPEKIEKTEEK